jgi:curved DNA-binding protein CbpA
MEQKDYYKVLGMNETSGAEEIKKAYRNLAFQYHPDRNAGKEEMMKAINEAYAVLSNPVKKQEYDSLRQRYGPSATDQFRQHYSDQDIFRGSDINQIFEELSKAFGLSSPRDIFSRNGFYGQSYRTFEFKAPGGTGRGFFFSGPMRGAWQESLKMPPYQTRQAAGIRQRIASSIVQKILSLFQKSLAKRLGIELPEHGRDLHDVLRITREQAAAGGKIQYLYTKQGDPRDLLVTVPQGIKDGQKIKLKGLGEAGKNGGESGGLYLKVKIRTPLDERVRALVKKLMNALGCPR